MWPGCGFIPIILYGTFAAASGNTPPPPVNDFLLMNGDNFQLMNGDTFALLN